MKKKHRKQKHSRIESSKIERIKKRLKLGESEVPSVVLNKCRKFYLIGAAFLIFGLLLGIIKQTLIDVSFTFLIAVVFAGYGYYIQWRTSRRGYKEIKGECIQVDYEKITIPGKEKEPKKFIIKSFDDTEDDGIGKLYVLPYFKQNLRLEEGSKVVIYINIDAIFYERNDGTLHIDNILGYEFL